MFNWTRFWAVVGLLCNIGSITICMVEEDYSEVIAWSGYAIFNVYFLIKGE